MAINLSVMNNSLIDYLSKSWIETFETCSPDCRTFKNILGLPPLCRCYMGAWDIPVNKTEPHPYGACTLV